jgi:cyclase
MGASRHGPAVLPPPTVENLGPFRAWTDPERLVGNLHRAYSELRGEPRGIALDYQLVVEEMVSFNDGRPLSCLARPG